MNQLVTSYKELIVWQKSVDLVIMVYALTEKFPSTERYQISSQMQRAAVSIPSNIAEGSRRSSRKDFRNFLLMAFSSGAELETHITIVKRLPFGKNLNYRTCDTLLDEVMRILNRMISSLRANSE